MENNTELRKLQLEELAMLNIIDSICRQNSIKYCLVGGTLLGAVRHQGFIPWDDDLDVAMPRSDYEKFIEVCKTLLPEEYYIHSIDSDSKYWLPFIKIRKYNTVFEENNIAGLGCRSGIYLDIFPLDDANAVDTMAKRIITKIIKELSSLFLYKIGYYQKHKCKLLRRVGYAMLSVFSMRFLQKFQVCLMKHYNSDSSEYYINYGSNYNPIKQTMPKKVYEPFKQVMFEGKYYSAPNDTDCFLKRLYGNNYMELPPVEKRITHNPVRLVFDTRKEAESRTDQ